MERSISISLQFISKKTAKKGRFEPLEDETFNLVALKGPSLLIAKRRRKREEKGGRGKTAAEAAWSYSGIVLLPLAYSD